MHGCYAIIFPLLFPLAVAILVANSLVAEKSFAIEKWNSLSSMVGCAWRGI
jgi:hypothetical protein